MSTGGRVLVDGVDLRDVTQNSLRSQMGIVLQDPSCSPERSVKISVLAGYNAADAEVIEEAADRGGRG